MAETPFETVIRASNGFVVSSCVYAVAKAGIADALGDAPKRAQDLAAATATHAGALSRILRVLCSVGIFEACDGGYIHTPASRLLRKDHPQSMRGYVLAMMPIFWEPFGNLDYSLVTGEPSFDKLHPEAVFKYFVEHPREARIFDDAMTGKALGVASSVVDLYDFSPFATIADIGGGRGHLLRAILKGAPNSRGILFDLPHVIEAARAETSDRLKFQAGDFFHDQMPVADAYTVMQVIHDWDDSDAIKILRGIRRAAPAHSKLLLIELLIPETPQRDWAKETDLFMLVFLHSRERTLAEYKEVLAAAGFRLDRVIDVGYSTAILESSPV